MENRYSDFDLDSISRSYFARRYELHELKANNKQKVGVPWSLSRLMTHPLSVCFKTILQIEPQTKLQVEIQFLILEGIFYIASVVEVILGARLNV